MIYFVTDNYEGLQHPSDGKRYICVIIITMNLLHVHMLKTCQSKCNVGLGLDRMYILKVLEHLSFGTLSKLVALLFFSNLVVEVCSLNHAQFRQ